MAGNKQGFRANRANKIGGKPTAVDWSLLSVQESNATLVDHKKIPHRNPCHGRTRAPHPCPYQCCSTWSLRAMSSLNRFKASSIPFTFSSRAQFCCCREVTRSNRSCSASVTPTGLSPRSSPAVEVVPETAGHSVLQHITSA